MFMAMLSARTVLPRVEYIVFGEREVPDSLLDSGPGAGAVGIEWPGKVAAELRRRGQRPRKQKPAARSRAWAAPSHAPRSNGPSQREFGKRQCVQNHCAIPGSAIGLTGQDDAEK